VAFARHVSKAKLMRIIHVFGQHIALLFALTLVCNVFAFYIDTHAPRYRRIGVGLLLGIVAIVALLIPIELTSNMAVDAHFVVIVIAVLAGGWLTGVIASAIAIGGAVTILDTGLVNHIGITLTTLLMTIAATRWLQSQQRWSQNIVSSSLGLLAAIIAIVWTWPIFPDNATYTIESVSITLSVFSLATLYIWQHIQFDEQSHLEKQQQLQQEGYLLHVSKDLWHIFFIIKDKDGRYLLANDTLAKFVGLQNNDELIGKTVYDFFPQEVAQRIDADDRRIIETKQALINYEEELVNPVTGETEWRLTTKTPVYDNDGACLGLVVISVDITEQKNTESALRKREQDYRALMEQAADGILLANAQGMYIDANQRALEMLGYTLEEIRRLTVADIVVDADKAATPIEREGMQGGAVTHEREMIHKDGHRIPVEVSVATLADGRRQAIIRDITERLEVEQHLRRLEQATLQAADGIAIVDEQGNFEFVNRAWAHMHGYEIDELIGQSLFVCHNDEQIETDVVALLGDLVEIGTFTGEVGHTRKDGSIFPTTMTITLLHDDSERPVGFIETARDISAQKEKEYQEQQDLIFAEALRDATSILLESAFDLDQMLDHILAQIARVIQFDSASVMLIENDYARIVRSRGFDEATRKVIEQIRFPVSKEKYDFALMIETNQPIIVNDVRTLSDWVDIEETKWIRSYLGAPLQHDNRAIGFINLDSAQPHAFNKIDAERLKDFADRAAIAIENARLYDNVRRRSAELESLRQASLSLASRIDTRLVLDTVLEGTMRLFDDAENAYIYLYQNDKLSFGMMHWRDGSKEETIYEPRPDGMHYTVARSGKPMVINNLREHPLFEDAPSQWNGATLAIPLRVAEHVVGVLRVYYPQPRIISENDLNLLQQLGDQAAFALENARLFEELQESEERFRQLAESVNEVFWLYKADMSEVIYVNPAYENVWGRPVQTVYQPDYRFLDTIHPEDHDLVLDHLRKIKANPHHVHEIEFRIIHSSRNIRWILARTFPVWNDDEVVRVTTISQDVTERKEVQQKIIDLNVEAERVRMLRNFISDASHDLKTPLQILLNKVHLLRLSLEDDSYEKHFDVMVRQIHRLEHMINNLLMLSRLDEDLRVDYSLVDLNHVLYNVIEGLEGIAKQKNIALALTVPETRTHFWGDENQLTRAITNLVENAVQYTPNGGQIAVAFDTTNGQARIIITDTGVGIEAKDLPHIFDRFYRADKARATNTGGSGLGLAIVKKIIEMHDGVVEVYSQPGVGSTFTVTLPLAKD